MEVMLLMYRISVVRRGLIARHMHAGVPDEAVGSTRVVCFLRLKDVGAFLAERRLDHVAGAQHHD